jgi:L-fuculose-phosphate aldolase
VPTAKYVTPGDTRLGESLLPYVKDCNTILLQSHGVVCFHPDMEQAYYQLEIVDAYARILLLAKQVGSIRPLDSKEMKELLELKNKFGLPDARVQRGLDKMTCGTDFLSRIGDIATHGMVQCDGGVKPIAAGQAVQELPGSAMERAIASLAPANYSEADVENLVQTITDQIMASVA